MDRNVMKYEKSVIDLIKMRKSTRTYENIEIGSQTLQKLRNYIAEINQEANIRAKIVLANTNSDDTGKTKKLGTYGVISGADTFLVGVLDKKEKDAVRFGYLFEKIVLGATDLGLQTCWLGGTFNKNEFKQSLELDEDEYIPIVSPVGIGKERPRALESAMKKFLGAKKRKPWSELFFDGGISSPLEESDAAEYAIPLEMVRIGPSAANRQPWRIVKVDKVFHFYLCRAKGYRAADYDLQKNDIGIAKCHFELSANELGLKGAWQKRENTDTPDGWEYVCSWVAEG